MKPRPSGPTLPAAPPSPLPSPTSRPADVLVTLRRPQQHAGARPHAALAPDGANLVLRGRPPPPPNYRNDVQQRLRDYIVAVMRHYPTSTPGTWSTKRPRDTPNAANPYRTDSPWYQRLRAGGDDGTRVRARRLHVRQPGARRHRQEQREHEADVERLQHRAARQTRQRHAGSCSARECRRAHRRRGPPVPPAAQRRRVAGDRRPRRRWRRSRARWSTTSPSSTCPSTRIPASCFAQRTIPPCLADWAPRPPQPLLSQQATLYRALVQCLQPPQRHLDHPLGHRRQPHLAQQLSRDPHQPSVAVRYRRQSEVGLLDGGRSGTGSCHSRASLICRGRQ